ncbi:MAG: VTT domain-containing protein [Ferruginibacter sp.]
MKKITLSFCLFGLLFSLPFLLQAKPVKLKIVNQYDVSVANLSVTENGRSTEVEESADGAYILDITGSDSLILKAGNYRDLTVYASSLVDGNSIVMHKIFSWKDLINPMFYIVYGGLWLLLFIIFAETGLFAGFFLPGDSLLFVAGIYSGNLGHEFLKLVGMGAVHYDWLDLLVIIVLVTIAGILGNTTGYWFGKKIGPAMFHWKDNLLFKQKYLYHAQEFYDKHGGGAIVMARFLPIIRTFAPIVAGIVQMSKSKFAFFNIIGCASWVASMILAGHFLQQWIFSQFGFNLKEHLELIVIGIVLVSTLPIILKLITGKKTSQTKTA